MLVPLWQRDHLQVYRFQISLHISSTQSKGLLKRRTLPKYNFITLQKKQCIKRIKSYKRNKLCREAENYLE